MRYNIGLHFQKFFQKATLLRNDEGLEKVKFIVTDIVHFTYIGNKYYSCAL